MTRKKFGIRTKLLLLILPIVALAFIAVIVISYNFSKSSIEVKTQRLLKKEADASAASIEAWTNNILGILNTAEQTMVSLKMNEDELLNYESLFLNKYDAFPDGIYIITVDGKVIDASVWVPESDPREEDYYKEGLECKDSMQFVDTYMDSFTNEPIVTAIMYSDTINGKGGVIASDISLKILSDVINKMDIDGNGDAFIIDKSTDTIIAGTDTEIVGKSISDINDSFYTDSLKFVKNGKNDYTMISSSNGTYMVSYSNITNTDWTIVVRTSEKNIYHDITKLGSLLGIFGVIVIVVLSGFLTIFISRLTTPIHKLTNAIVDVTNGDFTTNVNVTGNDEISIMSGSMKRFLEVMRETIGTIVEISNKIDNQAQNSNEISGTLHQSASGQAEAMTQMHQSMEELAESIGVIAENATTLANVVSDTNESGEQAIANIKETMTEADNGRTSMKQVTNSMEEMKQSMNILEDSIKGVGDAAEKIDNITSTIREIADETNLLALNASIEAARAGDAGRGFAVVATQIKSLAETSGSAAEEISKLIFEVTDMINETVDQSQHSVEQIYVSSEMVNKASNQFNNIFESIEHTNDIIKSMIDKVREANDVASNMAAITEEQSASAEEVEATAVSVQELANNVSKNSADVKNNANELATTAEALKNKISDFTI